MAAHTARHRGSTTLVYCLYMQTFCAFKSALKMSCVCTIHTKFVQARLCTISSSSCTLSAVELRQDHKACVCVSLTSSPKPLHVERIRARTQASSKTTNCYCTCTKQLLDHNLNQLVLKFSFIALSPLKRQDCTEGL